MTHKPPQGIDAPNCAHKLLKKQMVGEFVYYVCECGQKFRVEPWDGKVSVLAAPDPRKDLVALDELVAKWRARWNDEPDSTEVYQSMCEIVAECAGELEQRLAEMKRFLS